MRKVIEEINRLFSPMYSKTCKFSYYRPPIHTDPVSPQEKLRSNRLARRSIPGFITTNNTSIPGILRRYDETSLDRMMISPLNYRQHQHKNHSSDSAYNIDDRNTFVLILWKSVTGTFPNGLLASILKHGFLSKSQFYSLRYVPLFSPEAEMNIIQQRYLEELYCQPSVKRAIERTKTRLEKYNLMNYQPTTMRDLIIYFPKLGSGICASIKSTSPIKACFTNPLTGWTVCYDLFGRYYTVTNTQKHYVALDGTTDPIGKGAKFHFRDQ